MLKGLREKYKSRIVKRLKENEFRGCNFIVEEELNEFTNEIVFNMTGVKQRRSQNAGNHNQSNGGAV